MTKHHIISERCRLLGLAVTATRPGDGAIRYTITDGAGYSYTCCGPEPALAFLSGYERGAEVRCERCGASTAAKTSRGIGQ